MLIFLSRLELFLVCIFNYTFTSWLGSSGCEDQSQDDFQVIFGIYFVMFCTRCACFFASSSIISDWSPSRHADTYLYCIALLWVLPIRDLQIDWGYVNLVFMFVKIVIATSCSRSYRVLALERRVNSNESLFVVRVLLSSSLFLLCWLKIFRPSLGEWFMCHGPLFW